MTNLLTLNERIKNRDSSLTVLDLFNYLRYKYIKKNSNKILKKKIERIKTEIPISNYTNNQKSTFESFNLDWGSINFHLKYRATTIDDLLLIEKDIDKKGIEKTIKKGFLFSMLPLNIILPKETRLKYIPTVDYFNGHLIADIDPYGLFIDESRIEDKNGNYLGSKKFPHTLLMNIDFNCPIGCVGCYKSATGTREKYPEIKIKKTNILEQTKETVKWLNENPEVYDIILSGGEPLMRNNNVIKEMYKKFEKAKYLDIIRICTGTLFMGLPFRVDNELLNILKNFSDKTGKKIVFNAHLSNHYQITPEALIAINKIKENGFNIYSQVPIQEGINFFRDDLEKTMTYWIELGRRQAVSGIEPYKFILDQHPRTIQRYVPIELLLKVWYKIADSHDYPELQRPKTLSALRKEGNFIFSSSDLFTMDKEVDKEKGIVTYTIPKIDKIQIYREPLIEGLNDNPKSLENIRWDLYLI